VIAGSPSADDGDVGRGKIAFEDTTIPLDPAAPLYFEFEAKGVEFDRELREALPITTRAINDLLSPRGRFDIEWHQQRRRGRPGKTIYDIAVRPQGASVTYASVPYPLSNVRGTVLYDGGKVVLEKVSASNRGAQIVIDGQIPQSPTAGILNMKITGRNVPLDEDFKRALPEMYQGMWDKLAPKGTIQFTLQLNEGIDELGEGLTRYSLPDCA